MWGMLNIIYHVYLHLIVQVDGVINLYYAYFKEQNIPWFTDRFFGATGKTQNTLMTFTQYYKIVRQYY